MTAIKNLMRKTADGGEETCDIGAEAMNVTMSDDRNVEEAMIELEDKVNTDIGDLTGFVELTNESFTTDLATETSERELADTELQTNIDAKAANDQNVWISTNITEDSPGTNWVAASNNTEVTGIQNIVAAAENAEISGDCSVLLGGCANKIDGDRAVCIGGINNIAHAYNTVVGKNNVEPMASGANIKSGDLFIVGNGTGETARSNAFRVAADGNCYAGTAMNSTGAGYGHVVEWLDGNPDGEDRRGRFVALVGDKIKIFDPETDTFVFGIVSDKDHVSFIANNHADQWHGKFKRDVYGRLLTETVKINSAGEGDTYILNEGYDPDEEYIPRLDRPEWDVIEHDGFLIANDDGSCVEGGYCTIASGGTATAGTSGMKRSFYVMKRLDDTHIQIYK